MSQPYVGEVRMFAGSFAPVGWMFCAGQLLPISEYETLFNLIGTTYGGDGESTFALPDLRGRVPVHQGNGHVLGETGGVEQVTLTVQQIPQHAHLVPASTQAASSRGAVGGVPAAASSGVTWAEATGLEGMTSTTPTGGSQPHENMQPFLGLSFIISLYGVYPSQT